MRRLEASAYGAGGPTRSTEGAEGAKSQRLHHFSCVISRVFTGC